MYDQSARERITEPFTQNATSDKEAYRKIVNSELDIERAKKSLKSAR